MRLVKPLTMTVLCVGCAVAAGVVAGVVAALLARLTKPAPQAFGEWPAEQTPAASEVTLREQLDLDPAKWHEISCDLVQRLAHERAPHHDADFTLWATEAPTREVSYS